MHVLVQYVTTHVIRTMQTIFLVSSNAIAMTYIAIFLQTIAMVNS